MGQNGTAREFNYEKKDVVLVSYGLDWLMNTS
jgi:hypothetical protein